MSDLKLIESEIPSKDYPGFFVSSDGDTIIAPKCFIRGGRKLEVIEWLIDNAGIDINEILSECIVQESIKDYAMKTFGLEPATCYQVEHSHDDTDEQK
jgi:hypothetical protein